MVKNRRFHNFAFFVYKKTKVAPDVLIVTLDRCFSFFFFAGGVAPVTHTALLSVVASEMIRSPEHPDGNWPEIVRN